MSHVIHSAAWCAWSGYFASNCLCKHGQGRETWDRLHFFWTRPWKSRVIVRETTSQSQLYNFTYSFDWQNQESSPSSRFRDHSHKLGINSTVVWVVSIFGDFDAVVTMLLLHRAPKYVSELTAPHAKRHLKIYNIEISLLSPFNCIFLHGTCSWNEKKKEIE